MSASVIPSACDGNKHTVRLINIHICILKIRNIFGQLFIRGICVWATCLFLCWTVYIVLDGIWKGESQNCPFLMSARFNFLSTAFRSFLCCILRSSCILPVNTVCNTGLLHKDLSEHQIQQYISPNSKKRLKNYSLYLDLQANISGTMGDMR